jgi:hypothetical protein
VQTITEQRQISGEVRKERIEVDEVASHERCKRLRTHAPT